MRLWSFIRHLFFNGRDTSRSVSAFVKTQFDDGAENKATHATSVLDSSVNFDVNTKIVFMGEGFVAISAYERFLACMQPDVVCKVNILTKGFRALRTLIRPLTRMNTLVLALS